MIFRCRDQITAALVSHEMSMSNGLSMAIDHLIADKEHACYVFETPLPPCRSLQTVEANGWKDATCPTPPQAYMHVHGIRPIRYYYSIVAIRNFGSWSPRRLCAASNAFGG